MDAIIFELIALVKQGKRIDNHVINRTIAKCFPNQPNSNRKYSKKNLVPHYLKLGREHWQVDEITEKNLLSALQIKPRRTASGVATITVMTKPWACASACIYCPNDLRMPKSYLADEPVCQRAEHVYFDPYLQVISRLRALKQMGHPTSKIELIILGGTWSDYPESYQIWFVTELFRALNDSSFLHSDADFTDVHSETNPYKIINNSPKVNGYAKTREELYQNAELSNQRDELKQQVHSAQAEVFARKLTYNHAIGLLYTNNSSWQKVTQIQVATWAELEEQQQVNSVEQHRVVGLVVETRPDTITIPNLTIIRRLGCTKVQMGIQSLNQQVLQCNKRFITVAQIGNACQLLRLFGFKIHIHFMVNLLGSTPEMDKGDYSKLVADPDFMPDEVKLYPCMLINGTELVELHNSGVWQPYSETELVDVLVHATINTPRWTRISRMIRDFSAHDIVAGNKKSNLRQVVENAIQNQQLAVQEIRYREISTERVNVDELELLTTCYQTSLTTEYFLEWVTTSDKIVGFLRLSLPTISGSHSNIDIEQLPVNAGEAMIREVHIYGKVSSLNNSNSTSAKSNSNSQHQGLGRKLIHRACQIAGANNYNAVNVISAVGTREYYSKLGFKSNGLYQQLPLN